MNRWKIAVLALGAAVITLPAQAGPDWQAIEKARKDGRAEYAAQIARDAPSAGTAPAARIAATPSTRSVESDFVGTSAKAQTKKNQPSWYVFGHP